MVVIPILIVATLGFYNLGLPTQAPQPAPPSYNGVYQVVAKNITVNGNAALQPCTDFNASACPSQVPLSGVELIRYWDTPYYLVNVTAPNGAPAAANGTLPTSVYTVWFTNSTIFCVSPGRPFTPAPAQYPTCPTLPYHTVSVDVSQPSAFASNSTLGLKLGLYVAAFPDGAINISVDDYNILPTVNNLTAANSWPISADNMFLWIAGRSCGPPFYVPVGYAVYSGDLSLAQMKEATPLVTYAYPTVTCGTQYPAPYYAFQANSDMAGVYLYPNLPSVAGVYTATIDTGCQYAPGNGCVWSLIGPPSGYWTGSGYQYQAGEGVNGGPCPGRTGFNQSALDCPLTFNPFPPGTYTVLAADEWGQVAVSHFTVAWHYPVCYSGFACG